MKEANGDIWRALGSADAICVTTNGIVKANGALVMGAGIAKEAVQRFPGIQFTLGHAVATYGNVPAIGAIDKGTRIVSFPTKMNYRDPSDIFLIKRSAIALKDMADNNEWKLIVSPRPGCGLGGLDWLKDVKGIISEILDDRFIVCTK